MNTGWTFRYEWNPQDPVPDTTQHTWQLSVHEETPLPVMLEMVGRFLTVTYGWNEQIELENITQHDPGDAA